jgi:hypothetical protein
VDGVTLAYLFWHRPAVESGYEDRLREFHESLAIPSASFRLARLPFLDEPGYEDWYLVEDWNELGRLGRVAIETGTHDPVAAMSGPGWGGLWQRVSGSDEIPAGRIAWTDKPRGVPYADYFAGLDADAIWCRQLVLGPAPEVAAVAAEPDPGRVRVA